MIALCCDEKGCENCGRSFEAPCRLKEELIAEFNALGIEDMEEITDLYALNGAFVNLAYTLPGGQEIRSVEVGSWKDIEDCVRLLSTFLVRLSQELAEIVVYRRREKG